MELVISALALIGALFTLISAIGIVRLPGFYIRMHAVTKAGAFGGTLILLSAALCFASLKITLLVAVNILFFYFTAPIAAHMLSRSAYINNVKAWQQTLIDELQGHIKQKPEAPAETASETNQETASPSE